MSFDALYGAAPGSPPYVCGRALPRRLLQLANSDRQKGQTCSLLLRSLQCFSLGVGHSLQQADPLARLAIFGASLPLASKLLQ